MLTLILIFIERELDLEVGLPVKILISKLFGKEIL